MMEQEQWQWQEPGTAWRGAALYHITLTVPSRQPVLGRLAVPDDNPANARVQRSALGDALVDTLLGIPYYHPEARVLHFCLMPDHLHAVVYVRCTMEQGIKTLVRGFWQGVKKLGRACSYQERGIAPSTTRGECKEGGLQKSLSKEGGLQKSLSKEGGLQKSLSKEGGSSFLVPSTTREELKEGSARLQELAAGLCAELGNDAYYSLLPLFSEMPFIRPMGRYSQLQNTIRYLDMNPQRLATKRLMPGFFSVQKGIGIAGRSYDGVGNIALLHAERYDAVHVRRMWVSAAERGDSQPLRDYMNSRVLDARRGVVMVSPFISPHEKQVMQVLLAEQLPFILLADNGFRDYYKPTDALFDACAAGRLLILSPWQYDQGKRHITRADCMALNAMAEEMARAVSTEG
jgi:REP element-mobilizing transposase RayT